MGAIASSRWLRRFPQPVLHVKVEENISTSAFVLSPRAIDHLLYFFVSSHLFSGQVFRGASVDTGISLVILKFDGNLLPGLVSVLKLENVTVGADTVGAAFKHLH